MNLNFAPIQTTSAQTGSNTATQQTAAANGDFMAMFMQMLAEQQGGNASSFLQGLNLGSEDKDGTNTSAMEMAAALLGGGGYNWLAQGLAGGTAGNSDLNALLSGINGTGGIPSSIEVLNQLQKIYGNADSYQQNTQAASEQNAVAAETQQNAVVEAAGQAAVEETQAVEQQAELQKNPQAANVRPSDLVPSAGELNRLKSNANGWKLASNQAPQYISDAPVRVVNESTTQEDDMLAFYNGTMGFQSAVAQARRILNGSAEEDTATYGDETGAAAPMTFAEGVMQANGVQTDMSGKLVERVSIDDFAGRLEREVLSTRLGDEKRLSFKLSPEGLGDVSVQLTRKDGQILVSIVTASEATARLLNEQMAQVKGNLQATQPENVSVNVSQQENYDAMQQFNQSNQSQFAFEQTRQQAQTRAAEDILYEQEAEAQTDIPLESRAIYM